MAVEHLVRFWNNILDSALHHHMRDYNFKEWFSVPHVEFQRLAQSVVK